jgi:hypothetical protein
MTTKRKNFGGRRKREPEAGERVHAGLRVTPDLKGRIERAAAKSGRSLSQEMEFRIERSLSLDAAFGSGEMHDMALKMATAFAVAGDSRAVEKGIGSWLDDADCYRSAMFSVFNALIRGAPQGDEEQTARAIEALKSSLLTKIAQQRSKDNAR